MDPASEETLPSQPERRAAGAPKKLGPYLLLQELGRGGMGVVYRARHETLGAMCAVKVLLAGDHASPDALARFRREAAAVARLGKHPNLVAVHHADEEGGLSYYAMDLVEGASLRARIREGPLPQDEAARIAEKAARALHFAHSAGIVHRDVKPENILLDAKGEPQVTDFGLARDVQATTRLTGSGDVMGTPHYMAPEQVRGETSGIDARTDVYALGAVLYEMLTGVPAHPGDQVAKVFEHVQRGDVIAPRSVRPGIARDIETVCLKCLAPDPPSRYATAEALADDLARWRRGDAVLARRAGLLERTWRKARRSPVIAGLLLLLLASAATIAIVGVKSHARAREADERRQEYLDELSHSGEALLEAALAKRALGDLHGCREQVAHLEATIARLIECAPELAEPWYYRGRIQRVLEQEEPAEQSLTRAVQLAGAAGATPGSRHVLPLALYERGVARGDRYYALWQPRWRKLAEDRVRSASGQLSPPASPSFAETDAAFPELREMKEGALSDLRAVLEREKGEDAPSARHLAALGIITALSSDDAEQGMRYLQEALRQEPLLGECYSMLSTLSAMRQDMDAIVRWLEKGHDADRGSFHLTQALARQLLVAAEAEEDVGRSGDPLLLEAIRALDDYLGRDDRRVEGWALLARLHARRALGLLLRGSDPSASVTAAEAASTRALDLDADQGEALEAKGFAHDTLAMWQTEHGVDPRAEFQKALGAFGRAETAWSGAHGDAYLLPEAEHSAAAVRFHLAKWQDQHGEDSLPECRAAVGLLDKALAARPSSYDTWSLLAAVRGLMGERLAGTGGDPSQEYRKALEALDRAVHLRADVVVSIASQASLHEGLGEWLAKQGNDPAPELSRALSLAADALALNPRSEDALSVQANAHASLGDWMGRLDKDPRKEYRTAIDACSKRAATQASESQPITHELQLCDKIAAWDRRCGDDPSESYRRGLGAAARAMALRADDAATMQNQAQLHLERAEWRWGRGEDAKAEMEEARSGFDRALAIDPGRASTLGARALACLDLADIAAERGDDAKALWQAALDGFEASLRTNPAYWRASFGKGLALEALGRYGEASEAFRVVEETVNFPQAHTWRERVKAERDAGAGPPPPWLGDALRGITDVVTGELPAARQFCEKAIARAGPNVPAPLLPTIAFTHYQLACACAIQASGRTCRLAPERPLAKEEAEKLRAKAFEYLGKAIEMGMEGNGYFEEDADLATLRDDPRWAELMRKRK